MNSSHLSICIPTYNNFQQLHWCLHSLVNNAPGSYRILLVNNDSSPQSSNGILRVIESIGISPDHITIVQPGCNLKWMGSINIGLHHIHASMSEYFCMMNDDVIFPPSSNNFWNNMIELMDSDPSIGAIGPCSNFVSGNQNLHNVELPDVLETSCLIGFCHVSRTKVLKKMGGLDESLPGGDDIDLSIRYRENGYKLIVQRKSYLHHIGQQTGQRVYEGYWDSNIHQELVTNSMIKKHGIKKWMSCWTHGWKDYTPLGSIEEREVDPIGQL